MVLSELEEVGEDPFGPQAMDGRRAGKVIHCRLQGKTAGPQKSAGAASARAIAVRFAAFAAPRGTSGQAGSHSPGVCRGARSSVRGLGARGVDAERARGLGFHFWR